jgi:hypothetical protein
MRTAKAGTKLFHFETLMQGSSHRVAPPMQTRRAALFALCISLSCPTFGRAQNTSALPSASLELALSLAEARDRLEKGNRDIIAARQALDIALGGVTLAGARANPIVGGADDGAARHARPVAPGALFLEIFLAAILNAPRRASNHQIP